MNGLQNTAVVICYYLDLSTLRMSAPFHSIAKDPASQPDQADREVVEYVNSWFRVGATAHELRDSLGLVLLAVVSAASTLALFIEITKVSRLYSEHRGQLDPLLSQAWEKKSFETIRKICLSNNPRCTM